MSADSFRDRAALAALNTLAIASQKWTEDPSELAVRAFDIADAMAFERLRRNGSARQASDEISDDESGDGVDDDGTVLKHVPHCDCGNINRFGRMDYDPRCIVPVSDAAGDSDLDLEIDPDESLGPIVAIETDPPLRPITADDRERIRALLEDLDLDEEKKG